MLQQPFSEPLRELVGVPSLYQFHFRSARSWSMDEQHILPACEAAMAFKWPRNIFERYAALACLEGVPHGIREVIVACGSLLLLLLHLLQPLLLAPSPRPPLPLVLIEFMLLPSLFFSPFPVWFPL